jgi:hypothetical protein
VKCLGDVSDIFTTCCAFQEFSLFYFEVNFTGY